MAYLRDPNNLIPIMTSNSAPSGTAVASSEYTNPAYAAFKAFDGTLNTDDYSWFTTNGTVTGWIQYVFPYPKIVNKYTLYAPYNIMARAPKKWVFAAWDGTKWKTIDYQENQVGWQQGVPRVYRFNNSKAFRAYYLNIFENNGDAICTGLAEFEMMYEKYRDGNRFNRSSLLTLPVAKGGGF